MNRSIASLSGKVALAVVSVCIGRAWALDQSVGPNLGQPFVGPNGARISPVKIADTYNLDGNGVRLGMIEGTGRPRATHNALNGFVDVRPIPAADDPGIRQHPTNVAGVLIGRPFTFDSDPGPGVSNVTITGVASGGLLWSTWFSDTLGAEDFYNSMNWLRDNNVNVINMSDFMRLVDGSRDPSQDGQGAAARFVDHYVRVNDIVFVKSAGNQGPGAMTISTPGDAFNVITVGRTGAGPGATGPESEDYTRVHSSTTEEVLGSSRGPTADGRHKPDLVAPGSLIWTPGSNSDTDFFDQSGTSFAAPHVAGTLALLHQHASRERLSVDHLVKKAVILNSTSKHVRNPQDGDRSWPVWRANNYMMSGSTTFSDIPLNDAMGVGQLNGLAAVRQYVPATRSDIGLRLDDVGVRPSDSRTYQLFTGPGTEPLKPGSLVTATLTWDRDVRLNNAAMPGNPASYTVNALPNLNLELVNRATGAVAYRSQSGGLPGDTPTNRTGGDNVEHIYFNVPAEGNYDLVVRNASDNEVSYAIAWTSGTSDGPAFSVDHGAEGRQASRAGTFPNDVNALGRAGPGNSPIGGEIFTSSLNGTNMQRISGALGTRSRVGPHNGPPASLNVLDNTSLGVLGLVANDNINSLSWGYDGTSLLGLLNRDSALLFSVDPMSQGAAGTNVRQQSVLSGVGPAPMRPFPDNVPGGSPGGEAAGDVYVSPRFAPFGRYLSQSTARIAPRNNNSLFIDEEELGLQAPRTRGAFDTVAEDNLDALEMTTPLFVDRDGDGMHGDEIFFTLDGTSPSRMTPNYDIEDILVSRPPDVNDFQFELNPAAAFGRATRYADGIDHIGLMAGDVIDALVLSDVTPLVAAPFFLPLTNGLVNATLDEALFSLAPGSPSLSLFSLLVGRTLSPADVFYTDFTRSFKLFATAEEIGLRPGGIGFGGINLGPADNLDALDIFHAVPEPGSALLLILGAVIVSCSRSLSRREPR
jgi:hypothetical protein